MVNKCFFIITLISIEAIHSCPKYDRDSHYGGWKSWGDCQDTRAKVLVRDSKLQVTFRGTTTCTIDSGHWEDPYSGEAFKAASDVQIEHVIPLSEAHKSGAWAWSLEKRKVFTNFLDSSYHLLPIKGAVNSSKRDRDPAKWMPPNKAYWQQYALNWVKIKTHWKLKSNQEELGALRILLPDSLGIIYPEQAPEDICTDTGTVEIQWLKYAGIRKANSTDFNSWNLIGKRLPKFENGKNSILRVSMP